MKKFLVAALLLLVAVSGLAYEPNYSLCGIQGPPNCANLGPYTMCQDPCGQVYYKWNIGGVCQEGTCFEYQYVYDEQGNGPFQVIVPLPTCPYATCNHEGGELDKPGDKKSTWGTVKRLYK